MAKPPNNKPLVAALAEMTTAVSEAQARLYTFDRFTAPPPKGGSVYETYVLSKSYLAVLHTYIRKVAVGMRKVERLMKSLDKNSQLYKLALAAWRIANECLNKLGEAYYKMTKIVDKWLKVLKKVKHK